MKNKLFAIALVAILMANTLFEDVFAATKYGFEYDTSMCDVKWLTSFNLKVRAETGQLLGTMTGYIGVARRKGSKEYVLMTKEVMTPNSEAVNAIKGSNAKVYALSEYVSVKTTLPSLDNYQPKNTPSKDSLSISAGFSTDKTASIGASYTIDHSDLVITSKCETPKNLFYIEYDYRPSLIIPWASNSYVAHESDQYGVAEFEKKIGSNNTISFNIQYDARFGIAASESRAPWTIFPENISRSTCVRACNIRF